MNLRQELERRLSEALVRAGAAEGTPALVLPSAKAQFGDYQANGMMAAAKALKTNPRELAGRVVEAAELDDIAEPLEVAGPGFINIRIRLEFLSKLLAAAKADEHLGVARPGNPQTVVVDYSGPNLAKEMHVGHLRSTIIGDALARVLEFLGHDVIRQNHVGDWGTQFGMLLAYMDATDASHKDLADLEEFYRAAKQKFDEDVAFAETARQTVVRLQGGDEDVLAKWHTFVNLSLGHCEQVYGRLGVSLKRDDVRGESAYNDDLPKVVEDLQANPAVDCRISDGALCVFLEGFTNKDGEPLPVIVRKSDGGYLYATTDLAAMRYRAGELHADRILYVTDSRQALHFSQVFAVARLAGFVGENVSLEHVPFGTMMGADGKPFKTRTGGTVKLMDLLDEAETRAAELVKEKNPDLSADAAELARVAAAVGIGAVKYSDLAHNRNSDYVFAWDKMLALEGNTAPYMQYAYARIRSIRRKGGDMDTGDAICVDHAAERALGMKLAAFPETVSSVATECLPHLLCNYLHELAGAFMSFYENCPVLQAETDELRAARLNLCALTARTIQTGLDLLGIATLEQM